MRVGESQKQADTIIDGGSIMAPAMAGMGSNYDNDTTPTAYVIMYTVRQGDTVSTIAKAHGVTIDTITWENEISDVDAIKPGDMLRILAVSGLRHRVIKSDTVKSIADNYSVDAAAIIAFNELPANGQLDIGKEIVVPGGKKPEIKIELPQRAIALGARRTYTKIKRGWLAHPAPGSRKTQWLHRTNAVDLAAPVGTPIYAAAAGVVTKSTSGGWGGGYGRYVMIKHPNGVVTLYAHLSRNKVKAGQKVKQGQVIGLMGSTGRSTGSHVHFEVRGAKNPF
jgi:murein DD-endopeptidase MepM/ murein hydrolase activator NlpD